MSANPDIELDYVPRPRKMQLNKYLMMETSFFFVCAAMAGLLLMRDVGNISLPKWIFVAIAIAIFTLYDMNHSIIFTIFCIPFIEGLPGSYIFGAGLLILLVKYFRNLVINEYILVLIAILAIELLSFTYGGFNILYFAKLAVTLLYFALLIFNADEKIDYRKALQYFLLAALIAQVCIILQTIQVDGLDSLIGTGVRLGNTEQLMGMEGMRISFNPNAFGRLSIVSISILLVFLRLNLRPRLLWIALLIFVTSVGAASLSRNFLFSLALLVMLYLLSAASSPKKIFVSVIQALVICLGVYTAVNYISPSLVQSFAIRIAEDDISNGRVEITREYFNVLAEHPFRIPLGVGIQRYDVKYDLPWVAHNGLQEVLITWGVAGIILVTAYLYGIYRYGFRLTAQPKRKLIYILPFVIVLISVQAGQFFSSYAPLYFLPAFATMRLSSSDEEILDDGI